MSFTAAIRSVLTQYAGFTGRARRSEYWWFALFTVLVGLAAAILDSVLGTTLGPDNSAAWRGSTGVIGIIVNLALLLPTLAVAVRRLHDTDRSGWWLLIGLVPIVGAIVLLVFFVLDSKPGTNRFGANPKERPLPAPGFAGRSPS
jgi:uncharacterized membrane protein YhaH (DUF805 family)